MYCCPVLADMANHLSLRISKTRLPAAPGSQNTRLTSATYSCGSETPIPASITEGRPEDSTTKRGLPPYCPDISITNLPRPMQGDSDRVLTPPEQQICEGAHGQNGDNAYDDDQGDALPGSCSNAIECVLDTARGVTDDRDSGAFQVPIGRLRTRFNRAVLV